LELSSGTTYFVRAYATNAAGTGYGEQIKFTTLVYNIGQIGTVNDVEGNIYSTIEIGSQIWMAENLRTTKYNDSTLIPNETDVKVWKALKTVAYCDYDNNPANSATYGRLYNWFVIASTNSKNACPASWYVSTYSEQWTLIDFVGHNGGKLKETGTLHWSDPNTGAINETGFKALPGGYRSADGTFGNLGYLGLWWSTSVALMFPGIPIDPFFYAFFIALNYNSSNFTEGKTLINCGFSVRCIKN
jgi:uncharacterized protein (TIGR02145 family)